MITTISFDGDNTLWDFEKVIRHSLECVSTELMSFPELREITIDEMVRIRNEVAESLKGKVTNLEEIRLAAFKETLRRNGVHDNALAQKMNLLYLKHRFEDIELFQDVIPTLGELRKGFSIGLLSNGNSYPERCGLEAVFEFVVFSQDHGIEKPDKRIFEIALSEAKCNRDEMLHVGDSLESDILGASGASVKSVWLNRENEENRTGILPDYEIANLGGIYRVLSIINKRDIEDSDHQPATVK